MRMRRRAAEAVTTAGGTQPPPAPDPPPAPEPGPRPLSQHPLIRIGLYAWALIGVALLAVAATLIVGQLRVVVIPLVLALFPAAVLAAPVLALCRLGVPRSLAALTSIIGLLVLVGGLFRVLAPSVAGELNGLGEALERGYAQVADLLARGPFGLAPIELEDMLARAREQLGEGGELGARLLEAGVVVAEGFAGLAFGLFALFFYLKDGERIGAWLRDLFPQRLRHDVQEIGYRAWWTIGAYIRGQLLIALVDAVFIGIGIAIVGVPLALPLAVVVFFASLFPIVGALVSGALAVLVALTLSPVKALLVLAIVIAVQQLESHLLAPIVLARATELHPLAIISALAAGGVLLGVLGAFIAVPIAASSARAIGYLRTRVPG